MVEVPITEALDGAEVVKAEEISALVRIQVWYGGTRVRMFVPSKYQDVWREGGTWSISDREGKPVSESEIRNEMDQVIDNIREEER
jgi:hypothetical protein